MKILIVEDEVEIAGVWREELIALNYKIKVAGDGEQAMALAKIFKPDIILLDLLLPKKDGMTVLAELKSDSDLKKIPVLVMSNLEGDENIKKALSLGAVNYFVKTQHSIYELIEKVQNYVAK